MSKQPINQRQKEIWDRLVESHKKLSQALKEFFAEGVNRVALMRDAFHRGDIATALYVAPHLTSQELQQLFSELIRLSTAPGYAGTIRRIILALPQEWVLANIEQAVESILQQEATENEYRRILELYLELDHQLTYKLAQQAVKHSDEDIREAGEDFLDILTSSK